MQEPDKSQKKSPKLRLIIAIFALVLISAGLYMILLLRIAPGRSALPQESRPSTNKDVMTFPDKQLVIASIGVKANIVEDDISQLDKGFIVQRRSAGGSPDKVGNFVLTGHRFKMAWTPKKVQQASVLYNLEKLKPNGIIIVYWNHKRYDYKVTKLYKVKPYQIEVEAPSSEAKLTIYTCTLGGTYDGRVVVEAKLST